MIDEKSPSSAKEQRLPATEGSLIERLAHQLGITANAKCIFAEPIERNGVTIVPVAKAAYGFGGGGGKKEGEEGSGGGGGVVITPVGYIEIKNGETSFCPTRDWLTFISLIAAAAPIVLLTTWGLKRLFRRR